MSPDKSPMPLSPAYFLSPGMDEKLARISKILSTAAGIDATLTLVGYGLFLVGSQIPKLEKLQLKALTHGNSSAATRKAGFAAFLKLADLESGAKALASMCSDFRTFTRLWGMLGVYAMAKRQSLNSPPDGLLRAISYTQTLSLGLYYFHENVYYLAGKGVLKGWAPADIKRWAKISMKMFLAFVLMEHVRLYRARQLRLARKQAARSGGLSDAEGKEFAYEGAAWKKSALMNLAYTPLAVHWASKNGILTDGVIGALMSYIGWTKVKSAWAAAA
ncbi:25D9-5p [Diplocarpon rosae]|nr:25D9-5p [Diplocarpon rosae]